MKRWLTQRFLTPLKHRDVGKRVREKGYKARCRSCTPSVFILAVPDEFHAPPKTPPLKVMANI